MEPMRSREELKDVATELVEGILMSMNTSRIHLTTLYTGVTVHPGEAAILADLITNAHVTLEFED